MKSLIGCNAASHVAEYTCNALHVREGKAKREGAREGKERERSGVA